MIPNVPRLPHAALGRCLCSEDGIAGNSEGPVCSVPAKVLLSSEVSLLTAEQSPIFTSVLQPLINVADTY